MFFFFALFPIRIRNRQHFFAPSLLFGLLLFGERGYILCIDNNEFDKPATFSIDGNLSLSVVKIQINNIPDQRQPTYSN